MLGKRGTVLAFVVAASVVPRFARALPEAELAKRLEADVKPFLAAHGRWGVLEADGARLAWRAVEVENPHARVVFLPGAGTSLALYDEFLYDLASEGLNVYTLDARGSGLSTGSVRHVDAQGRVATLTHAESFEPHVTDLALFFEKVVKAPTDAPPALLGSSSGAVVASLFAARNPGKVARIALVNPLFELSFGGRNPAGSFAFLSGQVLLGKALLPAPVASFDARRWAEDEEAQTRSAARRAAAARVIAARPSSAAGGVTTLWAKALADASFRLEAESYKVAAPVLMMQSRADTVSFARTQDDLCRRLRACTKVTFADAGHRILLERDAVRDAALGHLLRFLNLRTVSSTDAVAGKGKKKAL